MGTGPDLGEVEATTLRMEERYGGHPLFAAYRRLCERLDADLSDPRDRALSRAAALMLIKFEAEQPSKS